MLANFLFRGSCRDPGNEHRVPRPRRSIGRGVIGRRRQIEIDDASATLTAMHRYSPREFTSCTPVGLKLRTLQPLGFASRIGLLISPTIGCTMLIAPGKPETVDVPAASSRSTVEVCGVSTPCVFGGAGSGLSGMCASLKFSSDILILLILELCSNDPRHSAPAVNSQRLFPFHPPAADAVASYQSRRGYHPHQRPDEPWSACRRAHPG